MLVFSAESTSSTDDHRDHMNAGRPQRDRGGRRPRRARRGPPPGAAQEVHHPNEQSEGSRRGGRGRGINQLDRGDVNAPSGSKPGARPQNGNGGAIPKQPRDNNRRRQAPKNSANSRGGETSHNQAVNGK